MLKILQISDFRARKRSWNVLRIDFFDISFKDALRVGAFMRMGLGRCLLFIVCRK